MACGKRNKMMPRGSAADSSISALKFTIPKGAFPPLGDREYLKQYPEKVTTGDKGWTV